MCVFIYKTDLQIQGEFLFPCFNFPASGFLYFWLGLFQLLPSQSSPLGFGSSPSPKWLLVSYLECKSDQVSTPDQLAWIVPHGLQCKLKVLYDPALASPASFTACWLHTFAFNNTEPFYVFTLSGHNVSWLCNFACACNDLFYTTPILPSRIISGSISPGGPSWLIRLV